MATEGTHGAQYQTLGLNVIREPEWNSRIRKKGAEGKDDTDSIEALSKDIKERGLQTPVEVEGPDENGSYLLVYGSRRLAACKLAGLHEIACLVRPLTSKTERMTRNAVENLQRKDLTSFETSRVVGELRKEGLKNEAISRMLGMPVPTVSNYGVMWENLTDGVKKEWAKGAPAARVDFLRTLASVDEADQLKKFDEETRRIEEAKEKGESSDTRGRTKRGDSGSTVGIRVNMERFNLALDFAKSGRTPSMIGDGRENVTKGWLRAFCDYLCGQTTTPPPGLNSGWDPDVKAKAKPAEKPKAKPAKKAPAKKGK